MRNGCAFGGDDGPVAKARESTRTPTGAPDGTVTLNRSGLDETRDRAPGLD